MPARTKVSALNLLQGGLIQILSRIQGRDPANRPDIDIIWPYQGWLIFDRTLAQISPKCDAG
jgi:hypothetical protein